MPLDLNLLMILAYALTGLLAGLIGGLLGLGGGIVIVPILHVLFSRQGFPPATLMQTAITTSLATITVTAFFAARAHHKKGAILWPVTLRLAPGIMIGAAAGALLADTLSSAALRLGFGVFEILVAIQIAFDLKPGARSGLPGAAGLAGFGGGVGFCSTLLGIGGGTLTTPFLLWRGVNIRNAIAVSAACGLPVAVAGASAMVIAGLDNPALPAHSLGYLHWPAALIIMAVSMNFAPLGARLAHQLPIKTLKRIFAMILLIVGIRMLLPG